MSAAAIFPWIISAFFVWAFVYALWNFQWRPQRRREAREAIQTVVDPPEPQPDAWERHAMESLICTNCETHFPRSLSSAVRETGSFGEDHWYCSPACAYS